MNNILTGIFSILLMVSLASTDPVPMVSNAMEARQADYPDCPGIDKGGLRGVVENVCQLCDDDTEGGLLEFCRKDCYSTSQFRSCAATLGLEYKDDFEWKIKIADFIATHSKD